MNFINKVEQKAVSASLLVSPIDWELPKLLDNIQKNKELYLKYKKSTRSKILHTWDNGIIDLIECGQRVQVGCNNVNGGLGYFGKDDGTLYSYNFSTDTSTLLSATLTSTSGLNSSFNSLAKGYFCGDSLVEALDFSTESVSSVNILPTTGNVAATSSTFQSNGLL
jgi:hypothetical protein